MDISLSDIKKRVMAKRGKGEYIDAGVLHNFNNSRAFLQIFKLIINSPKGASA